MSEQNPCEIHHGVKTPGGYYQWRNAEQRAEQAEAKRQRTADCLAQAMSERDQARQEAENLREALEGARGIVSTAESDGWNVGDIPARIDAVLHSSDAPASEPRDQNEAAFADLAASGGLAETMETKTPPCPLCGGVGRRQWQGEFVENCQRCGGTGRATNSAPADRPEDWETPCPERADGVHCVHWYDGEPCCACGDDSAPVDEPENRPETDAASDPLEAVEQMLDSYETWPCKTVVDEAKRLLQQARQSISQPAPADRPQTDAQREALEFKEWLEYLRDEKMLHTIAPVYADGSEFPIDKAIRALSQSGQAVSEAAAELDNIYWNLDWCDFNQAEWEAVKHLYQTARKHVLSQPAPAVPSTLNAEDVEMALMSLVWDALKVSPRERVTEDESVVRRALATHPADGDSPAVPDGYVLISKDRYECIQRGIELLEQSATPFDEGCSLIRGAVSEAPAAAPTPDEDGESDE